MRDKKACGPDDSLEIRKPVQALDSASVTKRLREEKTYEDHDRSVLSLYHEPSLRAVLTAIAASRLGQLLEGARKEASSQPDGPECHERRHE